MITAYREQVMSQRGASAAILRRDPHADGAHMANDGRHILVIDDDTDMHDVVRMILKPLGCRVTCCTTAPDGWAALQQDRPDLLLLDVMLSTPTEGFEVAARIRQDDASRTLPIVLISSMPQDSGFEDAGISGAGRRAANAFLEKPLSPQQLRSAVESLLASGNGKAKAGHSQPDGSHSDPNGGHSEAKGSHSERSEESS